MYEHGDYSKELKKYYNANTGKWISRILPSMQRKRKGIRVYDYPIQYDRHFTNRHIARVQYFLTYIYRRMIDEERSEAMWVYISSNFQRAILSNDFKHLIDILENQIKCIYVERRGSNPYDSRKSKVYFKLKEEYFDAVESTSIIYSDPLSKSLQRQYNRLISPHEFLLYEVNVFKEHITIGEHSLDSLFTQRIKRKQEEDRAQLFWDTLSKSKYSSLVSRIDRETLGWNKEQVDSYRVRFEKRYKSLVDTLTEYNELNDVSAVRLQKFANRIINPIIVKDREFRSIVRIDGEECIEYDMSTGYASLLYTILDAITNNQRSNVDYNIVSRYWQEDKDLPKYDFRVFLDDYSMCFGKNSIDFYHRIGMKLLNYIKNNFNLTEEDGFIQKAGALIQGKPYRNYIKDLVIRLINSHPHHYKNVRFIGGRFTFEELSTVLFTEEVTHFLNDVKFNKIYKDSSRRLWANASKMVMKQEVKVMRDIHNALIDSNIPYVSLHDGILVGKGRLNVVDGIVKSVVSKYRFVQFKYKL